MNGLVGYDKLPAEIHNQINCVADVWKKHMGGNLVGVYLHGSIALNAFNPGSGDVDILVVVKNALRAEEKLAIAKDIIAIDNKPAPLEMSAITSEEARNWKTPGKCVFHYSDFWTQKYMERFNKPETEVYVVDNEFPDSDVTSYIKLIKQCGIVLYGESIQDVFAPVSDEDFWAAISADVDDYDFNDYNPRYFASNILILGRILSFRKERKILSKYDAGLWTIENVPDELKIVPSLAMRIWFCGEEHDIPKKKLDDFREYLVSEIKK